MQENIMKTPLIHKLLHALGYYLVQPLAWVLRKQHRLADRLVAKGLPHRWVKLALLTLNLFILVSILFLILPEWIVVSAAFLFAITYLGIDIEVPEPQEPEWRMGIDGYGLYRGDIRIDGGSIEDEETYHHRD